MRRNVAACRSTPTSDRTMSRVPIQRIRIDGVGRLLVAPLNPSSSYAHIYREANGLRWDAEENALVALEPARWGHSELLRHIIHTLRISLTGAAR
jgi:hypothetical protein